MALPCNWFRGWQAWITGGIWEGHMVKPKARANGGSRRNRDYPPMERLEGPSALLQHLMDAIDVIAQRSKVTRADFAAALGQSQQSVTKYFRGERVPSPDVLDIMCQVVKMPSMFGLNILYSLMPRTFSVETGSFPPEWSVGDLELLNSISNPAAYMRGPQMYPMATNDAWRQHFPWMPEPSDEFEPNLMVELMTNEGAPHTFGDSWPKVCWFALQYLVLFGAPTVPQKEIVELFTQASVNPDFGRYVMTVPDDDTIAEPTVVSILGPDNVRRPYNIKILAQKWQKPEAWDLFMLIPISQEDADTCPSAFEIPDLPDTAVATAAPGQAPRYPVALPVGTQN
ncbi:helix-turn-helix domain-containing protein [Nocardia tengchongensis]|uniref:helix-turn-helix domain-containing protein n=1 Tax=Nocardia tengchongensis TaxID=2055889 RepID=UPI0036963A89